MGLRFDMNSMDFHLDDFYRLSLFSHAELIHHVASRWRCGSWGWRSS